MPISRSTPIQKDSAATARILATKRHARVQTAANRATTFQMMAAQQDGILARMKLSEATIV